MKYVLYALLVAAIFGLVALGDFLLGKLFPKTDTQKHGKAVRMPRYSFILGLILFLLSLLALLFLDLSGEWLLQFGCVLVLLIGLYLLVNFQRFGIFYDDRCFIYRTLTRKAVTYRYGDIKAQRSYLARSGFNTTLYVGQDEIPLYGAMQGLSEFLSHAFYRWCEETGTDPDTVENDPHSLVFFPDLPET